MTAAVPAGFSSTSSNVEVVVPTAGQTFTSSAYLPVRSAADIAAEKKAAAAPQRVQAGQFAVSRNIVLGGVGAIGIGLLGVIAVVAAGANRPATNLTLSEQIKAYGVMAVPGQAGPASRRRRSGRPRRPGPSGSREGAVQQQGPRGPARHLARSSGPGPAAGRVAADARGHPGRWRSRRAAHRDRQPGPRDPHRGDRGDRAADLPPGQARQAVEGVQLRARRHPPADVRQPVRRPVTRAVHRHHRPRGLAADLR